MNSCETNNSDPLDPNTNDNPGPIDAYVLYNQVNHISQAVWEGQERGVLRCHEHTTKLDEWRLTQKQIALVEKAGFGYFRLIPSVALDKPLISALIERWRGETNTFHFRVGEMTITLKDVALILGLAIDGEPVIGLVGQSHKVCERLLGKVPQELDDKGMVKLSWLKESFSQCPEDASNEGIEQHTRAYLLYIVGSTIFATTSGNKVPTMYLQLFEDFEKAGKYAWGAAALAFLYRALAKASLKSQKSTTSGSLTLLQCWSNFYLNIGRPRPNEEHCFPLVLRWWKGGEYSGPRKKSNLLIYRKALDMMQPDDVEWLPYKYMEESTFIPEGIKSSLILGTSKTMLICFEKAERHLPDRCSRQFGMLQPIPEDVQRWERKSRMGKESSSKREKFGTGGIDLSKKMEEEIREWLDRKKNYVKGDDYVDESKYMEWYLRITRVFVERPKSLASEYLSKIAAMREIAKIADTIPMNGMLQRDKDLFIELKDIAHKCLMDVQGGGLPNGKLRGKRNRKER